MISLLPPHNTPLHHVCVTRVDLPCCAMVVQHRSGLCIPEVLRLVRDRESKLDTTQSAGYYPPFYFFPGADIVHMTLFDVDYFSRAAHLQRPGIGPPFPCVNLSPTSESYFIFFALPRYPRSTLSSVFKTSARENSLLEGGSLTRGDFPRILEGPGCCSEI